MDEIVKQSIESRKQAFFSAYNIVDKNIIKEIEGLFKKIEDLGKTCSDASEFETKFASSPLNQEYIDMFTKVAQSSEAKITPTQESDIPEEEEYERDETIGEAIKDDVTRYARRKARQEAYDKVRDIPGVGTVLGVKQHIDFFSRFKKDKK